jgi:hypothetical protein
MFHTIYIKLLNEGTEVFRPVDALLIRDNIYEIAQAQIGDEDWEFNSGSKVYCNLKKIEHADCLVAVKEVQP